MRQTVCLKSYCVNESCRFCMSRSRYQLFNMHIVIHWNSHICSLKSKFIFGVQTTRLSLCNNRDKLFCCKPRNVVFTLLRRWWQDAPPTGLDARIRKRAHTAADDNNFSQPNIFNKLFLVCMIFRWIYCENISLWLVYRLQQAHRLWGHFQMQSCG